MVLGSYVKGTSFVGINSSESEGGVMKDVKEKLTCPCLRTLSLLHDMSTDQDGQIAHQQTCKQGNLDCLSKRGINVYLSIEYTHQNFICRKWHVKHTSNMATYTVWRRWE